MTDQLQSLILRMSEYLSGKCSGRQIVREIDTFISDDHVYALSEPEAKAVQNLQNEAAFYVSNPDKRQEFHEYIGDDELRTLIREFLRQRTKG